MWKNARISSLFTYAVFISSVSENAKKKLRFFYHRAVFEVIRDKIQKCWKLLRCGMREDHTRIRLAVEHCTVRRQHAEAEPAYLHPRVAQL